MNPKENDNEIIELTDEELDEIFADDDFDNGEEDGEIHSFYFSNPDPYAKVKPRPDDAPRGSFLSMKMAAPIESLRATIIAMGMRWCLTALLTLPL